MQIRCREPNRGSPNLMGVTMESVSHALPAAELPDRAIVERIRAGDTALYEILMRRHNQRLSRTIRAILRNDREVEDVMQQAYLDAYLHLHQFKGDAQFATWLTRIAVNRAIRSGQGLRKQLELVAADGDHDLVIERAPNAGLDP